MNGYLKNKHIKYAFIVVCSIVCLVFIVFFVLKFYFHVSTENLGTAGDFVGGILNPILSCFSLLVVVTSLFISKEELNFTKREFQKAFKHSIIQQIS